MSKLWGGRFKKELSDSAKKLSYSLHIDKRLAPFDIKVNRAHARALCQAVIFSKEDYEQVDACLQELGNTWQEKEADYLGNDEDIHSCIERLVTERCGDLGKKLHTGKSRNDQVITDTRLFLKASINQQIKLINQVREALVSFAQKNSTMIFPGMTHFQPAQPVLIAHHMLAYYEKFTRDLNRLKNAYEAADVCTLGSGALAGNNYGLDRELIASELGFTRLSANSMDAVSDRDFILDYFSAATICMTHMSRFCEELVVWNSPLLGFISLGDEFTTGSSIMPQKKNPDIAELIRGKSGRVLGHFVALQQCLKGLPLTYNRDLQEDKEMLFDTVDTMDGVLTCMAEMIPTIVLNEDAIHNALLKGHVLATELADYLVQKEIPFREAHHITGEIVLKAIDEDKQISDFSLEEFKEISDKIEKDIYDSLTLESAIAAKSVYGGTAEAQVKQQIKRIMEENKWNNR